MSSFYEEITSQSDSRVSAAARRLPPGYTVYPDDAFTYIEVAGYDTQAHYAGDGWKFHLSVDPQDLPRATDIVMQLVAKHGVQSFKVTNPALAEHFHNPGNSQAGKHFTLYGAREHADFRWDNVIRDIEVNFEQAGIRPSVSSIQGDRMVPGSRYAGYRNELAHGQLRGYANEDGYLGAKEIRAAIANGHAPIGWEHNPTQQPDTLQHIDFSRDPMVMRARGAEVPTVQSVSEAEKKPGFFARLFGKAEPSAPMSQMVPETPVPQIQAEPVAPVATAARRASATSNAAFSVRADLKEALGDRNVLGVERVDGGYRVEVPADYSRGELARAGINPDGLQRQAGSSRAVHAIVIPDARLPSAMAQDARVFAALDDAGISDVAHKAFRTGSEMKTTGYVMDVPSTYSRQNFVDVGIDIAMVQRRDLGNGLHRITIPVEAARFVGMQPQRQQQQQSQHQPSEGQRQQYAQWQQAQRELGDGVRHANGLRLSEMTPQQMRTHFDLPPGRWDGPSPDTATPLPKQQQQSRMLDDFSRAGAQELGGEQLAAQQEMLRRAREGGRRPFDAPPPTPEQLQATAQRVEKEVAARAEADVALAAHRAQMAEDKLLGKIPVRDSRGKPVVPAEMVRVQRQLEAGRMQAAGAAIAPSVVVTPSEPVKPPPLPEFSQAQWQQFAREQIDWQGKPVPTPMGTVPTPATEPVAADAPPVTHAPALVEKLDRAGKYVGAVTVGVEGAAAVKAYREGRTDEARQHVQVAVTTGVQEAALSEGGMRAEIKVAGVVAEKVGLRAVAAGVKAVGGKIPVVGAVVGAGFAVGETGYEMYKAFKGESSWTKVGTTALSGVAGTVGGILGFGAGEALQEGVHYGSKAVVGEKDAARHSGTGELVAMGAGLLDDGTPAARGPAQAARVRHGAPPSAAKPHASAAVHSSFSGRAGQQHLNAELKALEGQFAKSNWGKFMGDGDAQVSAAELRATMKHYGIGIAEVDRNGDGHITGRELTNALSAHNVNQHPVKGR